ncbi:potassium channel subfamily K member 2-like [Artemia franciscana]|uniref:Potassium channel domain-containing protein n=1 Tax=Artemia franciscana TaxID=6661 RepID=A0AA88LIH2_ARTSF|nr:hypothetical protein QYM36_001442 [Artemia franciscana]
MHEGEDLLKTIPRSERSKTYNGDLLAPECVTEVISTEQNNRQKDQKSECRSFKWKVLKFCEIHPKTTTVLSRVLIFIFLVLFNGFGAQVFVWLEQSNEVQDYIEAKATFQDAKNSLIAFILNSSEYLNSGQVEEVLATYDKKLSISYEAGVNMYINETHEVNWSFINSAFFASTILTTVGYGHIAPATFWGKIFCICFALVGIPLTLVVLSDIGEAIAKIVSVCEKKLNKRKLKYKGLKQNKQCCRRLIRTGKRIWLVIFALLCLAIYLAIGSVFFMFSEGWSFLDSFYFCFITVTTIGFGDYVPAQTYHMLACTAYILVGLALTSAVIEMIRLRFIESLKKLKSSVNQLLELSNKMGTLVRKVRDQVMYGDGTIDINLINEMMKVQRQIDQVQAENGANPFDSIFDIPTQLLLGPQLSPSFLSLRSTDIEEYDNVEIKKHAPPLEWEHDWEDLWVRLESGEKVSYRLMKIAEDYKNKCQDK